MKKSTIVGLALSSGWVGLLALTGAVYVLPFVPCKVTLMLLLGIANGRCLARWI